MKGYINHMIDVAPWLRDEAQRVGCSTGENCEFVPALVAPAGTVLGYLAVSQGDPALNHQFDLGTSDDRTFCDSTGCACTHPACGYVVPERYSPQDLTVVCPLDLYYPDDPAAKAMWNALDRAATPRCGETVYDRPGTAQGNWFIDDDNAAPPYALGPEAGAQQLALNPYNFDPSWSIVSLGTLPEPDGPWLFLPRPVEEGINVSFESIEAGDSRIYCYFDEAEGQPGRILLQLGPDGMTLTVELNPTATCNDGPYQFENPTVYRR